MEKRAKKKAKKKPPAKDVKEAKEPTEAVTLPKCIKSKAGVVQISVGARPNSKADEIIEICDEYIGVAIQAPPKDGEANLNLISFLSEVLGVKKTCVSIDKGSKSKCKIVEVQGLSYAEVFLKLQSNLHV